MKTLELISRLYHKEAGIRRQATLVIGMVEETGALMALQQRAREETDDDIKRVIMWAGKRVQDAEKAGFLTVDAIFDFFKIDREIESGIDPEEAEFLRHQTNVAGSTSSGGMFKDIKLGSTMDADAIKTGRLGQRRIDKKSLLRIPPIQPTDTDITRKVKQLMDGSDVKRQKNAALSLREINNPQSLPYIALVFYRNENPEIRDLIEKSGKVLYWSINYHDMESNGRLNLEIAKRRREKGVTHYTLPTPQQPEPPKPEQPSVTDILNQAQKSRKRRKK